VFREFLVFLGRVGRYPTGLELAEIMGRSTHATWYALRALVQEGVLARQGVRYSLTPEGVDLALSLGETAWREDDEVQKTLRLLVGANAAVEDGR